MILYINTTDRDSLAVALIKGRTIFLKEKIAVRNNQSEKLLNSVEKILKKTKINFKDIKKIRVENKGGSFTSLRVGVVTANALGFALNIPVEASSGKAKKNNKIIVVEPEYDRGPNITISKKYQK